MSNPLTETNLKLLRFLEDDATLGMDKVWSQEKNEKVHLPFIHGTEHDGKVSSNSHLDYFELLRKYSSPHEA